LTKNKKSKNLNFGLLRNLGLLYISHCILALPASAVIGGAIQILVVG